MYGLGVYRQYHDGQEVPRYHETDNAAGGTPYDIIEHGFQEVTYNGDSTPGDVDVRLPGSERNPSYQNRVIELNEDYYVKRIELYEKIVAIKQSDELSIARGEDPMINYQDDRRSNARIFAQTVKHLREQIQYFHTCLIPHRCHRGNTPLSFTPFIQLTIRSPTRVRVYRHSYTMKLNQAMKKMNTAFFGGRKHVLRSRVLFIAQPLIVIRLPEGVRMRIQELKVTGHVVSNYEALKLIVEEASYPLNSMTIYNVFSVDNHFGHSIVRSAKALILKSEYRVFMSRLPWLLRPLKNNTILVDCIGWSFPVQDQIGLVEHWLNEDKAVGTSLYYDVKEEETATQVLDEIARQFNSIRPIDNIVMMPMNNGNRLVVSYTLIEQPYNRDQQQKFRKISQPITNLLLSTEVKNDITDSQEVSEQCNEHVTTTEETSRADQDDTPRIENIVNSEALIQKAEEPEQNLRMVPEALENNESDYSKTPGELRIDTETKHPASSQKTPEGSPKSTSSCISSDILTDSILDDRDVLSSIEQFERGEGASSISRPSSFPMNFSTSSSSAPCFNFTRKTPEFIPRMMLEEFELLDRSIEKRKMDIRDLLKRIQSAKRRHRRFSEHIERVQREHHINY